MTTPILLNDGDSQLVIVQDSKVIAHTSNIGLSHAEFVRRTFGELPDGAWVGTLQKTEGAVMSFNSRTFYGNQLPAPQEVWDAVKTMFQ